MKKDMPLEGLRWSRDSGSALCDTPQTAVLGRAGGGNICFFRYEFLVFGVAFVSNATPCLYFLTFSPRIQHTFIVYLCSEIICLYIAMQI